eukprot:CAMPEP_0197486360 /NCGR_PEP_ID=MMETSP1311-20131121/1278_1 /TAXON_ID=464262 /ORGANISM="Genus nov. species nov., Strain RCC856" /LENGTH=502 /DNA_ID=CAMNT_0043029397 /DNA_START=100 /DNA_END=1608 /DNA_ORIENTATION=-
MNAGSRSLARLALRQRAAGALAPVRASLVGSGAAGSLQEEATQPWQPEGWGKLGKTLLQHFPGFSSASSSSSAVPEEAAADAGSESSENDFIQIKGLKLKGRPLYLDGAATTRVDPRVLDAMLPYFVGQYGNPHSRTHMYGWETEDAIEVARGQVASVIGADAKEVIFTSGATESNNLAIKGVANFYSGKKRHIITTQTDHKCVLDSCRQLEQKGFEVTYLPVDSNGLISLEALEGAIRKDTAIVSVMAVNNEIGVIQPLKEIGAICRKHKVFFHTDAAQAVGKIPMDVNEMNIDLMSISGHKLYGPKGIGAIYLRRRPRVRVEPIINGGGQERGLRSGTLAPPLVIGFGKACEVAEQDMASDLAHATVLSERLIHGIESRVKDIQMNGDRDKRYPGIVNISFSYVEGESLLMGLKELAISSGSACTSASLEPSYVLRALGLEDDMAHTSLRFGIGRFTTEQEIDYAIEETVHVVEKLRELSPLWEMVQEGIDISKIEWSQH